ncbi:hypothetical protein [Variovorax sp. JS1663]|uniref:hypothetical protein n=1 Tax=Variovorax sp. JS1663 TaxID=1851577 RepID=UPI000B684EF0|nr:hypothetical protein [Variovorax sp. JS1663]OUM00377.1 hypothetical protein A8M77_21205 [Variovorax sp. JS1663]
MRLPRNALAKKLDPDYEFVGGGRDAAPEEPRRADLAVQLPRVGAFRAQFVDLACRLLANNGEHAAPTGEALRHQAEAFEQALLLMIAQRRPGRNCSATVPAWLG